MAHSDGLSVRTLFRVEGPEDAQAGTLIKYSLFSEDERGNFKDVNVNQLDGWLRGPTDIRGRVLRNSTGNYSVEFIPSVCGVYHLDVTTEGAPIFRKGDIVTNITQDGPKVKDKLNFELEGHGLHGGRVRESVSIVIRAIDAYRTPTDLDMGSLVVTAKGPDNARGTISRIGAGTYDARIIVNYAGDYTVTVAYDGKPVIVQDGVKFSEKTNPARSSLTNTPANSVRIGNKVHFRIQSKDSNGGTVFVGGDSWEATASGPGTISHLLITDNQDGTYTGELILPSAGTYTIDVRLGGTPLSNSPFKVTAV